MWNTFDKCREVLSKRGLCNEFISESGLSEQELCSECDKIFNRKQSFGKSKSEVIAFIFENSQLDICEDDIFLGKINHFDIVGKQLWSKVGLYQENALCNVKDSRVFTEAMAIEPTMDFGHLAPDWNFIIQNGIPGILKRLEQCKFNCADAVKTEFYDNSIRVFNALIAYIIRLADAARKIGTEKMLFAANNLETLTKSEPQTLAQAMQLTFLIYLLQTNVELAVIRSLGGLDRLYVKFYRQDLKNGTFTQEQLREIVRYFLLKFSSLKVVANIPFYICGKDSNGNDATNEFTFVLLEEYKKLNIYDPKIHVMYHKSINPKAVNLILEMIRNGNSSFVFINTDTAENALKNLGISEDDAKKVIVYGCYEVASEGEELPSTCAGRVNMPKVLEMYMYGGESLDDGKKTLFKPNSQRENFEEFYDGFKKYLKYAVTVCMDTIAKYEACYSEIFTAPMLSATFKSCVENGIDIFSGGAKYNNTSVVCSCLASVVDSIVAIKKLVYDEKRLRLEELKCVLKNNWAGYEKLRQYALSNIPKYGNNNENDFFASDLCDFLAKTINGYQNCRGGVFRFGMFSIDYRFRFGKRTGATPDGRLNGEPLSKNFCAVSGQDKKGVTTFLKSVLSVNAVKIPDGCVADCVLHSSATQGREGILAMSGLLATYMENGGFAIQFNVFSADTLKEAQVMPEKYKNLQVRLCGWNTNFVNLSKKEQDEFIISAEN